MLHITFCVMYPLNLGEGNWLLIPPSCSAQEVLTLCGKMFLIFNMVDVLHSLSFWELWLYRIKE